MADKTLLAIAGSQQVTALSGDGLGGATDAAIDGEDLRATAGSFGEVVTESGADHILALTDLGNLVSMTSGSANTFTVPPDTDVAFPVGSKVDGIQYGAGLTTITPGSGVTIRSRGAALKSAGQYSRWIVEKIDTNEWVAAGDLVA
jgi:hypothetical protein